MPHSRKRLALETLKKRLTFFPIVAIQGARQTGKSFLVHELLAPGLNKSKYVTFDDEPMKSSAMESCKAFLTEYDEFKPLMIDEAQKVPEIFDALKFKVDQKKIPGKYIILGSTEFSKQTLIRESLTGRMGRIRLYPLSVREAIGLEIKKVISQKDIIKTSMLGGLPGICFTRDNENRAPFFQDWIDLTCYRDLQQFKKMKLDGELASRILKLTATLAEPTKAEISKKLKVNAKKIESHLEALTQLFVLNKLSPHPSGTGKPIYLPFDAGIASFMGADRERSLHVLFLNELFVKSAYTLKSKSDFYYYRSTGKKMIHIIEVTHDQKTIAHQIITHDSIKKTDSELMKAFLVKNAKASGQILAPIDEKMRLNEITYMPWESLA